MTVILTFSLGRRGDGKVWGLQLAPVSLSFRSRLEQRTTVPAPLRRPRSVSHAVYHLQSAHHVSLSAYYVLFIPDSVDLALSMPFFYSTVPTPHQTEVAPTGVSQILSTMLTSG